MKTKQYTSILPDNISGIGYQVMIQLRHDIVNQMVEDGIDAHLCPRNVIRVTKGSIKSEETSQGITVRYSASKGE